MSREKIRSFFVKLAMYATVGVLAAGLALFVIKSLYPQDDVKTDKEEAPAVHAANDKKAPPVEMSGSISDEALKRTALDREEQATTPTKAPLVTLVPETPQETATPEAPTETAIPETPQEDLEQEATLAPPEPESDDSGSNITASLDGTIQDMISSQYAAGGTIAVSVGRISDGIPSSVNDHQMQAASLIKLFVAGCVYETMSDPSQYESLISSMISVSDNTACNSLVEILGGGDTQAGMAAVNAYCMAHGFAETHMGRLMLQPNDQDDNYTSVQDCGKFLMDIYNGNLAGSGQILQYMKQQERRGKIPAGVPSGIETANKTGELDTVENDAAIIFHPSGAYILCVMSEYLSDPYSSRLFMNSLSETVYGLMG